MCTSNVKTVGLQPTLFIEKKLKKKSSTYIMSVAFPILFRYQISWKQENIATLSLKGKLEQSLRLLTFKISKASSVAIIQHDLQKAIFCLGWWRWLIRWCAVFAHHHTLSWWLHISGNQLLLVLGANSNHRGLNLHYLIKALNYKNPTSEAIWGHWSFLIPHKIWL